MWSFVGMAVSQVCTFGAMVLVSRCVGKVVFGELGIVLGTISMLGVFAGTSFGVTATRHIAESRNVDREKTGRLLGLLIMSAGLGGIIMAGILFPCTPLLARYVLAAPHLTHALQWGCGLVVLSSLSGALNGALTGFEAFRSAAVVSVLRGTFGVFVTVFGAWKFGLTGALVAMVLTGILECGIGAVALNRECRRTGTAILWSGLVRELPVLWRFSLPTLLGNAMVVPATWVAATMLVNKPNGYAEMGVFNAANQFRTLLLFLPAVFANVNIPVLSSLQGAGDTGSSRAVLGATLKWTSILVVPMTILIVILKNPIMRLYGAEFDGRGTVLAILAPAIALVAFQVPFTQLIVAAGKMWQGMFMNAGWALVLLGTGWCLLRMNLGAEGLAMAYLAAYVAHSVWTFQFARRFVRG